MLRIMKRLLIGSPLPNWRAVHEKLPKILALPVFASDAISSVGYATEEILLGLIIAGTAMITETPVSIYLAIAVIALLAIVVTSYRQTVHAYPNGGGSYIVAKDNLGTYPGLLAGASVMVDYVLTVAVSVSSGVAAILSFTSPDWYPYREAIALGVVAFIALMNLRGMRESGLLFSIPTYTFVGSAMALVGIGVFRVIQNPGFIIPPPADAVIPEATHPGATGLVLVFLILRAFASGCSAMTGTEAISDGVQAFKKPESKNAAATLFMMATILTIVFGGITFIAWRTHVLPIDQNAHGYQTVLSQIASALVGKSWFYYFFQVATALILVLAANTSFADFPRLGSIMARDRFLPRQLYNMGDRLVFQNGIILLASLAAVLIVAFKGEVSALIPLYAIGVFLSFTLSQWGMAKRFARLREPGWRRRAALSGFGALVTAVVVIVQAVTKFTEGAWIVLLLLPALMYMFSKINEHYVELGNELRLKPDDTFPEVRNIVLVLTPSIHKGVLPAISFAKGLSKDVRAIHINTDPLDSRLLEERWDKWGSGIPLLILESPYRSLVDSLIRYVDKIKKDDPNSMITIVIPEFVTGKWWHSLLHNQSGLLLKFALLNREGVVTVNMRYHVQNGKNSEKTVPVKEDPSLIKTGKQ